MDWKTELLKRLDALADKLGTTSAYLWHVLVKQAIATGVADVITSLILVLGIVFAFKFYHWADEKAKDCHDDSGYIVLRIVLVIGAGVSVIESFCSLYSGILELVNPEYYALHEILQTLSK